jgi:hypothetical protein
VSVKSIAIPSRLAAKKERSPSSSDALREYAQATRLPERSRVTRSAHAHRFSAGERLLMAPGGREISRSASPCLVLALLPYEGVTLRYRVRSESENFERIVDEVDLSPLTPGLE